MRAPVPRRRTIAIAATVAVAVALGLAWRDARATRADLERARRALAGAEESAAAGDVPGLEDALRRARGPLQRARRLTGALPLRAIGWAPVAGRSARAAASLARAAEIAVDAGLEAAAAAKLFPAGGGRIVYGISGGRLDVAPWAAARPPLERAAGAARRANRIAARAPRTWVLPSVARARAQITRRLAELERGVRYALDAGRIIPAMLAGAPKRYLVVLQNPAEARATGGLVGAFALIETDRGRIRLRTIAPNTELKEAPADLPMPEWFRRRYDRFASRRHWSNVNMEPDFRLVGPLLARLFERTIGPRVDGVIGVDPIGLAELLRATGPIPGPRGTTLEAATIARLVMSDSYNRMFPDPGTQAARKAFFVEVGRRILARVLADVAARPAAEAFSTAARAKHLMVWVANSGAQRALEDLGVAGAFRAPGPFVGLVNQNASADKLDYYLRRQVDLRVSPGVDGSAAFRLTVRLRNGAPATGLSPYVLGGDRDLPPGDLLTYMSVYLPSSAEASALRVGGARVDFESERVPGALVVSRFILVPRGRSAVAELEWELPRALSGAGRQRRLGFTVLRQPMVAPDLLSIAVGTPRGWRGGFGPTWLTGDRDTQIRATLSRPLWGRIWDFLARRID
ncbi:MAG: DUF4012 domain-containing protein [Acidobacteria bacterium]|nr:DUF4012 domain-containing protein [Acidobacteriota bacterium]